MKITEVKDKEAVVELGGLRRKINLGLLEEIKIGDFVLVHAGFAIQRLDEERAEETLSLLKEMVQE